MNAVTLNYASTHFPTLMTQIIDNSEPTFVCDDSGAGVVVLNVDDYEAMQETLYLLSSNKNRERLEKSIKEHQEGKTFKRELIEE